MINLNKKILNLFIYIFSAAFGFQKKKRNEIYRNVCDINRGHNNRRTDLHS